APAWRAATGGRERGSRRGAVLRAAGAGAEQQGEGNGGGGARGNPDHAAKVASPRVPGIVLWYQCAAARRRPDPARIAVMPTLLIADDHPLFRAALRQAAE